MLKKNEDLRKQVEKAYNEANKFKEMNLEIKKDFDNLKVKYSNLEALTPIKKPGHDDRIREIMDFTPPDHKSPFLSNNKSYGIYPERGFYLSRSS